MRSVIFGLLKYKSQSCSDVSWFHGPVGFPVGVAGWLEPNQPTRGAYADRNQRSFSPPLIQLNELGIVWGFTPPNTWSYFKPPNLGTLTTMVDGKGYWVLVTDPINITIVGFVITPGRSSSNIFFGDRLELNRVQTATHNSK